MGSFYVSHAAARLFREQESGSFVHFTSTSGLVGNFGQANYAAAKLGIVGLSKSIALDMNRFNVRSNCISPFAWSRLIGTIPTETEAEKARVAKIQQMGPEKIAPVAAYLLSDASKDVTGQIFGVRMNEIFLMSQSRPLRSVHRGEGWTPQTIAEHQRYPEPDIVVIDPKRFKAKVGNTSIKRLYTGCLWAEGPAWNAQGQYLVWSDIPNNRQLRYLDDDGHISEQFHKPSNEANGNSFDTEGRQISAERTRLVRYEHDGSVTTLAEQV